MISEPILRGRAHRIVFIETGTGSADTFRQLAKRLRATGSLAGRLRGKTTNAKDSPAEWKRLISRMLFTCDEGLGVIIQNPAACKRFRGNDLGLGEFKSKPYRVIFFECERNRGLIVVTHCFKKKRGDTPQEEMKRARRLQAEYYAWLDSQN